MIEKTPFYSKKISEDLFCHRQLLKKIYTLHSKFTPFLCVFLCFCFLSCLFFQKIKKIKNSCLIIGGGQKRGLPHLNYWGRVLGLPPRVYVYGLSDETKIDCLV